MFTQTSEECWKSLKALQNVPSHQSLHIVNNSVALVTSFCLCIDALESSRLPSSLTTLPPSLSADVSYFFIQRRHWVGTPSTSYMKLQSYPHLHPSFPHPWQRKMISLPVQLSINLCVSVLSTHHHPANLLRNPSLSN